MSQNVPVWSKTSEIWLDQQTLWKIMLRDLFQKSSMLIRRAAWAQNTFPNLLNIKWFFFNTYMGTESILGSQNQFCNFKCHKMYYFKAELAKFESISNILENYAPRLFSKIFDVNSMSGMSAEYFPEPVECQTILF